MLPECSGLGIHREQKQPAAETGTSRSERHVERSEASADTKHDKDLSAGMGLRWGWGCLPLLSYCSIFILDPT